MKVGIPENKNIVDALPVDPGGVSCGLFAVPCAILWGVERNLLPDTVSSSFFYTGARIINDGKLKELFNVETQDAYQVKLDVPQLDWRLPFNHTA